MSFIKSERTSEAFLMAHHLEKKRYTATTESAKRTIINHPPFAAIPMSENDSIFQKFYCKFTKNQKLFKARISSSRLSQKVISFVLYSRMNPFSYIVDIIFLIGSK